MAASEVNAVTYRKHFIPLESNPDVFTKLIHRLGVSTQLAFYDVLSVDDPDLLDLIPRPALALVLVFPTSETYAAAKEMDEAARLVYDKCGEDEQVVWYKQTINNACGLYGILHAVSNGESRQYILEDTHMLHLLERCSPLKPKARAVVLENDAELERAYKSVALEGDSEAPSDPEDEVDFHYVCFVKSHKDSHVYELDGDYKGPVDKGMINRGDDMLSDRALSLVKEFIQREQGQDVNFSLMVLASRFEEDE